MAGVSIAHLAQEGLPSPASPAIVTVFGAVGAFVGAAFHLAHKRSVEGIQLTGFLFWFAATGIALAIYVVALSF